MTLETPGADRPAGSTIPLAGAIVAARSAVEAYTGQPVDAVSSCARHDGGWRLVIDVVEAPARLGENDLLATFEIELDAQGEILAFRRTGRYNRTEVG